MFMSVDVAQRIMDHGLFLGADFCGYTRKKQQSKSK